MRRLNHQARLRRKHICKCAVNACPHCKRALSDVGSLWMAGKLKPTQYQWLCSGREIFPALTAALDGAQKTIRLEIYIFSNDTLGQSFRETLIQACKRGVLVRVLVDA